MSWVITGQEAGPLGLLDQYGGAAAAYSLRNLSLYHADPVVRVRRDNDNAEQDFTATEVSDGSLAAWVGAGNNGFVRTWYDQSDNQRNAEQTVNARQPLIILGGLLNTSNGKPAINFTDAREDSLVTASVAGTQPVTAFSVSNVASNSGNRYIWNINQASIVEYDVGAGGQAIANIFAGSVFSSGINVLNQQVLRYSLFNKANSEISVNDGSVTIGNAGTGTFNGVIRVGARNQTGLTDRFEGNIQEIILYFSNQSSVRSAIGLNINAHYAIY